MVTVGPANSRVEGDAAIFRAHVESAQISFDLQYTVPAAALTDRADPLVAAGLLPAMRLGEALTVRGAVSPKLLQAVPTIQEIFHCWDSAFQLIPVEVETEIPMEYSGTRGVACFFSGGVDSFYTVLKHLEEIDALVYVHGFDVALEDRDTREGVSRSLEEAAAELGKPLIQVETNVRAFLRGRVVWDMAYGAAAASVALLLSPLFRRLYIASSYSYSDLVPSGSDPVLDPLWSTEAMELVHDGNESTRFRKIARIATSDTALRHLRVCLENRGAAMNCGRCRKCLAAMIGLHLVGALERCPTFARPLDENAVAQMDLTPLYGRMPFIIKLLQILEERGSEPALARALRTAVDRVEPQIVERQQREIEKLKEVLASTQVWARELETAAINRDRDLAWIERGLPAIPARLLRRFRSRP